MSERINSDDFIKEESMKGWQLQFLSHAKIDELPSLSNFRTTKERDVHVSSILITYHFSCTCDFLGNGVDTGVHAV